MKKQKLMVGIIILMFVIMMANSSNAMQSRPDGESLKKGTIYFCKEIRNMESTVLGLEINLDETTYLDTSGNGVDVHMAKNTEWGTAAMLSASAYGTAPSGKSDASTTGNATGVYQMADSNIEIPAAFYNVDTNPYNSVNLRYYNLYTSSTIVGDATTETAKWRGAANTAVISSGTPMILRSYNALFGCSTMYTGNSAGYANYSGCSRAALVIGTGL